MTTSPLYIMLCSGEPESLRYLCLREYVTGERNQ
jgi:hypothetical protein